MTSTGIVLRSTVPPERNYLNYRDVLRKDFWYSCAYCSLTEVEAMGIGFEIDHYLPQSDFPGEQTKYKNLMWSCSPCNKYKGNYFSNSQTEAQGYIVIRPDEDDPRNHFDLQGCRLEPITTTGEFNSELLRLNRQALIRIRELRERFHAAENYIALGLRGLTADSLDSFSQENRPIVVRLRNQLGRDYDSLVRSFEELIAAFAKSDLIDEEPERPKEMQTRRQYLKEIKAITPERATAAARKPNTKKAKRKKASSK